MGNVSQREANELFISLLTENDDSYKINGGGVRHDYKPKTKLEFSQYHKDTKDHLRVYADREKFEQERGLVCEHSLIIQYEHMVDKTGHD